MERGGLSLLLLISAMAIGQARAEMPIPAFTAYLSPDPNGARVSQRSGLTGWKGSALKVLWFGEIKHSGELDCAVSLRLPTGVESRLRLSVGAVSHEQKCIGEGSNPVRVSFGKFDIGTPGYQKFSLESLNDPGKPNGDLEALLVDGSAAE